jgi:glycosyltransferase involved in cell wall biosynthesis
MPERTRVAFQGRRDGRSAFGLVNAHWSRALEAAGYHVGDYSLGGPAPDILIHHDFESRFTAFDPPSGAHSVAVRTWDFGPLPAAWVAKINRQYTQYWAHTHWIAGLAREAGVDPERIRVVPHGVDPGVFRPDGPRYPLATEKQFRLLFVGGVSVRKGSDLLLEAFRQAFTAHDDVCLVLKDHSGDLFYRDDHARARIAALHADPMAPEIVHLDAFLPEPDLAALYRSCEVAVFPYRAEGFCIPILEAMACGTPAIVPEFGACLDFCTAETSYLVKPRRIRAPVSRSFRVALGFAEEIAEVDFCELPVPRLVDALRAARDVTAAAHATKSAAGVARAHGSFSWAKATETVLAHLAPLSRQALPSIER